MLWHWSRRYARLAGCDPGGWWEPGDAAQLAPAIFGLLPAVCPACALPTDALPPPAADLRSTPHTPSFPPWPVAPQVERSRAVLGEAAHEAAHAAEERLTAQYQQLLLDYEHEHEAEQEAVMVSRIAHPPKRGLQNADAALVLLDARLQCQVQPRWMRESLRECRCAHDPACPALHACRPACAGRWST